MEYKNMDSCENTNDHCYKSDGDEYLSITSSEDFYATMDEAECRDEYFDTNDNFKETCSNNRKNYEGKGMHDS